MTSKTPPKIERILVSCFSVRSPSQVMGYRATLKEIQDAIFQFLNRVLDVIFWVPSTLYVVTMEAKKRPVSRDQLLGYGYAKLLLQQRIWDQPCRLRPVNLLKHGVETLHSLSNSAL